MSRINSRAKGQRGEREVIDILQAEIMRQDVGNFKLQRNTLQCDRGGSIGNADIAGLPFLAVEVKNCAVLNIPAWWTQAVECARNSTTGAEPVLIYKAGRGRWRVMMWGQVGYSVTETKCPVDISLEDFLRYFRARLLEWVSEQRGIPSAPLPLRGKPPLPKRAA